MDIQAQIMVLLELLANKDMPHQRRQVPHRGHETLFSQDTYNITGTEIFLNDNFSILGKIIAQ